MNRHLNWVIFTILACLLLGCTEKKAVLRSPAAPALKPDTVLTQIAFGSCADQSKSQKHWKAILKDAPQLFLFIGDNVYGDVETGDKSLPELTEAYAVLGAHEEFDSFQSKIPILPTWDDHDYGQNDKGADFILRKESEALFLKFWGVPQDDPRRTRDGIYRSTSHGPEGKRVQLIVLDTRFFRGGLKVTDERGVKGKERYLPTDDTTQTMLGEAQWKWLKSALEEPADLRLLVSSVQILATDHGFESWALFPHEKDKLAKVITETGAKNIVVLSGDRHIGGFYKEEKGFPYPLVELTSSSLNKAFGATPETLGPPMVGSTIPEENYGLIQVDWDKREVQLKLKGMTGETLLEETLSLSTP